MPSYQFNNFTGRLKTSSQIQPLYPIAPHRLQSADPPTMIWDTIKTKPVQTGSAATSGYSTLPPNIAAAQKKFQPPGWRSKPVYLMGGTKDKVLLGATLALMAVGFVGCADFFMRHAPNK